MRDPQPAEIAQLVKHLLHEPGHLDARPRTHTKVEGEEQLTAPSSDLHT